MNIMRTTAIAIMALASITTGASAQTQYRMRERIVGMPTVAATPPASAPVMRTCDIQAYKNYGGTLTLHPTAQTSLAMAKATCNGTPDITVCTWNSSSKQLRYSTSTPTVALNGTGVDWWAAICT